MDNAYVIEDKQEKQVPVKLFNTSYQKTKTIDSDDNLNSGRK